jgi:hypothetical protein
LVLLMAAGCAEPAVTAAFFGKAPAPPGRLAVVKAGMSFDEAKSILPGDAKLDHNGVAVVPVKSGQAGVGAAIEFDDAKVAAIVLRVPGGSCEATLSKAWGAPQAGTTLAGEPERYWINERDRWKAVLTNDGGCQVRLGGYEPMTAEFFGDKVEPPAPLAKVKIGMSVDDAERVAPELVAPAADDAAKLRPALSRASAEVPSDVHAFAEDGGHGVIENVGLTMKAEQLPVIKKAWGEPTKTPDGELMWAEEGGGWRARTETNDDKTFKLVFDRSSN